MFLYKKPKMNQPTQKSKPTIPKKQPQKTNNKNSGSQKDINLLCAKKSVPRIDLGWLNKKYPVP